MICLVVTLKIQDGKNAEFEAIVHELATKVRANEPGNSLFQLAKDRTDPNTYKFLEIYKDQEAIAAHRASDHFRELGRKMGAYMDGRPEAETYDGVEA